MDGRKRYKNVSVDEKLFIRFQETENGGFENALVWTGPNISIYYINTNEIPGELSRENMISSHVKITCYLHM